MTRNPVIRLRGVRSNGVNLVVLADVWCYALPDNEFAAPDMGLLVWPRFQPSAVRKGVAETNRPKPGGGRVDGGFLH
jgi:hypothetical protein